MPARENDNGPAAALTEPKQCTEKERKVKEQSKERREKNKAFILILTL